MLLRFVWAVIFGVMSYLPRGVRTQNASTYARALDFLLEQNAEGQRLYYKTGEIAWTFNTNITDENREALLRADAADADFRKESARNASLFDWQSFTNMTINRWFGTIADVGIDALPDKTKLNRLNSLLSEMQAIYSGGIVRLPGKKPLRLEPGLTRIMAQSRDYRELMDVWKAWRDATGKKMKDMYGEFVVLSNEGARASGYLDTGDYWRSWYEDNHFERDVQGLFKQLQPLYEQLHAYTRRKLMEVYDKNLFPEGGHIPAHLLGNMWAQSWFNIFDLLKPFKNKEGIDVTPEMKRQNYTVHRMFKTAEEFFTSLGLDAMPETFWNRSMFVRPSDGREVVCHASAWDFFNGKDFRIKMCTDINMDYLITIHHEMGHIQYYLQYKNQPIVFRSGANPGFHEAIGDVLALSASTPKHLEKINLLHNAKTDNESEINYMLGMALDKIAFLPFGYLIDQWRWNVFSGQTREPQYNTEWWQFRCQLQGVSPPVPRSENDFDPGAKFHIPDNTPYIRYFVSYVIQFQFHKALCAAANQTGPLHRCDIYQSKAAGRLLSRALQMGSSRPWPEVMQLLTGQNKMDVGPLLEYFQPLTDWLKEQNKGYKIGWSEECPKVIPMPSSAVSLVLSPCLFTIVILMIKFWQS